MRNVPQPAGHEQGVVPGQPKSSQSFGARWLAVSGAKTRDFRESSSRDKAIGVLTVLGFVVPALAYCVFVQHYSINVLVADQWINIPLVAKAFSGHLAVTDLWAQHNENRMLFPNLVVLALAYSTHLDVRIETFASVLLLFGSVVLIIWTHKRRSPATPLLWYCPVAILMVTWAQYENALWGFQIAWYIVLICLMGTLAVLNRRQVTAAGLIVAAGLAVIGSYSSLQGLLIWVAGFVLLMYHGRGWRLCTAWIVTGAATTALYFFHLDSTPLGYYRIDPFAHPIVIVKLFFFSLGNVAGKPLPGAPLAVPAHGQVLLGSASPWIIAFGVVIFVCGVLAIVNTTFGGNRHGSGPLGVALILFSFAFAGLTTIGRGLYGYSAVSASRYTTYDLLALVGAYLVVISRPSAGHPTAIPTDGSVSSASRAPASQELRRFTAASARVLPAVVMACIVIQVVFGYYNGLSGGRGRYGATVQAGNIISHYRDHLGAHDGSLFLATYASTPEAVLLIHLAEHDKLSMFNSP